MKEVALYTVFLRSVVLHKLFVSHLLVYLRYFYPLFLLRKVYKLKLFNFCSFTTSLQNYFFFLLNIVKLTPLNHISTKYISCKVLYTNSLFFNFSYPILVRTSDDNNFPTYYIILQPKDFFKFCCKIETLKLNFKA